MFYSDNILIDMETPLSLYNKIKSYFKDEITFLFESVVNSDKGNYSYIIVGAKERITHKNNKTIFMNENGLEKEIDKNPFDFMKNYYADFNQDEYKKINQDLNIGFSDGFIGYIGYDMVSVFEPVLEKYMNNLNDEINIPDMDLIRPKLVLVFSHKRSILTLVTTITAIKDDFSNIKNILETPSNKINIKKAVSIDNGTFSTSKEDFFKNIDIAKEKIKSGDIFQIVISNRYSKKIELDSLSFYRILRSKNPSPYLFLLDYEDFSIIGSSPEVMVGLDDGEILLRPIAGTRKRGKNSKRDKELEEEMLSDNKERAEHIMLVDLGRNDVGRVAKAGTVKVSGLMRVEKYSHVMHMVSDVKATIQDDKDMFDLFASTFTAGTMTGAPKIKAMEIIAELEKLKRTFYSGSIGYFGFDGNMDSSITIRTALYKDKIIHLQSAAGIVTDSKPELEYLEVQNKLGALMSSLEELEK